MYIPAPILFNILKHHRSSIRQLVQQIAPEQLALPSPVEGNGNAARCY